jgi:ribosome-associated translation inhibitor RaiA
MQIAVHASGMSLPAQTRAYVEYRMFSAVSGLDLRNVSMNVRLEEHESPRMGAQYRCSVVLTLGLGGRIRVRATGDRVYLTIDRAAKSLSRSLEPQRARGSLAGTPGE